MRRETRRYLEAELRDYHNTKMLLRALEEEVIVRPAAPDGYVSLGGTYAAGDPTGRAVTVLVQHRLIQQAERIVGAIRRVLDLLPHEQRLLVQLRYWQRPPASWKTVARRLHAGESTCRLWNRQIIDTIAEELGMW